MSLTTKAIRLASIKFLTQDETKRLFSVIREKRDRALFLLAYRHGLRASEVGLLQVADVDLKTSANGTPLEDGTVLKFSSSTKR